MTESIETVVEATPTPEEVEAAQIKAAEEHARNMDPEEIAARSLQYYTPAFQKLVDKLSRNELRRVLKNMVEFPLGKDYKHKEDSDEAKAFAIGNHLLEAKWILISSVYHKNGTDIIEQAKKMATEQQTETKEGETNV